MNELFKTMFSAPWMMPQAFFQAGMKMQKEAMDLMLRTVMGQPGGCGCGGSSGHAASGHANHPGHAPAGHPSAGHPSAGHPTAGHPSAADPPGVRSPEGGYLGSTPEQEEVLRALPVTGPVYMLNLYRFKPDGGAQRFFEFMRQGTPVLEKTGARVLYQGLVKQTVIGPNPWDFALLVEYPSAEGYKDFYLNDPDFKASKPLRDSALADSRLYLTQPPPAPPQ